jgi:tRNA pseudouridine38-40 synthase
MQIRCTLEYDGSNYSGWQLQVAQDTIQARLETALEQIFAERIRVRGAGRTDAGAHARGQAAAFKLPRRFDPNDLKRALNALLPPDIAIVDVMETADTFDPRRSARSRLYEYRVLNQPDRSAFEFRYAWLVREPLDVAAMDATAGVFIGEHDFAAFRTFGSAERTTVRRVFSSEWRREGALLVYRIEATAFLRHMVRTMVSTMVEAGRGRLSSMDTAELLERRDRASAPAPAPACGLFLMEVRY